MQVIDGVAPVVLNVPTKTRETHAHVAPWYLQHTDKMTHKTQLYCTIIIIIKVFINSKHLSRKTILAFTLIYAHMSTCIQEYIHSTQQVKLNCISVEHTAEPSSRQTPLRCSRWTNQSTLSVLFPFISVPSKQMYATREQSSWSQPWCVEGVPQHYSTQWLTLNCHHNTIVTICIKH